MGSLKGLQRDGFAQIQEYCDQYYAFELELGASASSSFSSQPTLWDCDTRNLVGLRQNSSL